MLFSFAFYLALLLFLCSVKSVFLHILSFLFKLACIRSQFLSFFFFSRNPFSSLIFFSPLLILFPHVSNFPIYPHFFFFCDFLLPFPSSFILTQYFKGRKIWKLFFLGYCQERAYLWGLPPNTTREALGLRTCPPQPGDQSLNGWRGSQEPTPQPLECSLSPDAQFDRKRDVFIVCNTWQMNTPCEKH